MTLPVRIPLSTWHRAGAPREIGGPPVRGSPSIPEHLQPSDLPTSVADPSLFFCLHGDGGEILMPAHNT